MPKRLKLHIIFFLVFCLPGIAILGYSIKLAKNTLELTSSGWFQTGTIIRYERPRYQGRKARVGSSLCSVIQFQHNHRIYTFADAWCGKSPKDYPVGSVMPVVFDPGSPEDARINQFWELHGVSLVSALIGTPWLLIGIALLTRVR